MHGRPVVCKKHKHFPSLPVHAFTVYTDDMSLFSKFRKNGTPASGQILVTIDSPTQVHPSQGIIPITVTLTASSEPARITTIYAQLVEKYNRHREDFQQVADDFHEVKAEAQESVQFSLEPRESRSVDLQLNISNLRNQSADTVQDNRPEQESIAKILHTGPVISNVLRLGDNKENVHYILKVAVEANGTLISPPSQRITIQH